MKKYMIVDENGSILQDDFDTKDDAEFQSKEWANSEENYIGIDEPDDGAEKEINPHLVEECQVYQCSHCNHEQDDFEVYGDCWACDLCKKYNDLPDEFISWIVVPPKVTKKELQLFFINNSKRANNEKEAWDKFLYPALKKDGYEKDGFIALKIDINLSNILQQIDDENLA